MFCYEIIDKPVEGCIYIRDGLWLQAASIPDRSPIYTSIHQAKKMYDVVYSHRGIVEYADNDNGMDTYGIIDTPLSPLANNEMVVAGQTVVGFFIHRYIGQSHLFLFDEPATHRYVVNADTKYELSSIE